jgi:release factor glutamine methyltransferase
VNIEEALRWADGELADTGVDAARREAQRLLAWAIGCRREDLLREPTRPLAAEAQRRFEDGVARRKTRVPLPYITGVQWFYGREFRVNAAVLIPRPETELLISNTLASIAGLTEPAIADIGTGSGCVAITIACERPDARVWATDISSDALDIARDNASRLGVSDRITFLHGDLLQPLFDIMPPLLSKERVGVRYGDSSFDAVVSNPPYVASADVPGLQPEVREYEPRISLVGLDGAAGVDGTALYPKIFAQAALALKPGGWMLVEIGQGQADAVTAAAAEAGYADIAQTTDLAAIPRVIRARKMKSQNSSPLSSASARLGESG